MAEYNLVSPKPPPNNVEEGDQIPEEVIRIEEPVEIPKENIINESAEVKKEGEQEGITVTQVSEEKNLVDKKEVSQSTSLDEQVEDEPFRALASSLNSWSENTVSKLKEVDRISRELGDLKKEAEKVGNRLKDVDSMSQEIAELKKEAESTVNKLDDMDEILVTDLKSWTESTMNRLKDVDSMSQEIAELKKDIQNVKSVLTTITKILTS